MSAHDDEYMRAHLRKEWMSLDRFTTENEARAYARLHPDLDLRVVRRWTDVGGGEWEVQQERGEHMRLTSLPPLEYIRAYKMRWTPLKAGEE